MHFWPKLILFSVSFYHWNARYSMSLFCSSNFVALDKTKNISNVLTKNGLNSPSLNYHGGRFYSKIEHGVGVSTFELSCYQLLVRHRGSVGSCASLLKVTTSLNSWPWGFVDIYTHFQKHTNKFLFVCFFKNNPHRGFGAVQEREGGRGGTGGTNNITWHELLPIEGVEVNLKLKISKADFFVFSMVFQ